MWVWEQDTAKIKEAQKAIDDFNTETQILELEKQIDAWEEYRKEFASITTEYEYQQNKLMAVQALGANWEKDIMNKRISLAHTLRDAYKETYDAAKNLNEEIQKEFDADVPNNRIQKNSNSSNSSGSVVNKRISPTVVMVGKTTASIMGNAVNTVKDALKNLKGYDTGGVNQDAGLAQLHGTSSSAEVIFNAVDAKKLWAFIHNLDTGMPSISKNNATTNALNPLTDAIKQLAASSQNGDSIKIENLNVKPNDATSFVAQLKRMSGNR